MRLYLIALVLLVLGIAGGVFAGGIVTIVLVPLALIVLMGAVSRDSISRTAGSERPAAKSAARLWRVIGVAHRRS